MVKVFEFVAPHFGKGYNAPDKGHRNVPLQMPSGAPVASHVTAGAKAAGTETTILKIAGVGTILWDTGVTEEFDGVEYRGVEPGTQFTINA